MDGINELQFVETRQRNGLIVLLQPVGRKPRIFLFNVELNDNTGIHVYHLESILFIVLKELANRFTF